MEVLKYGSDNEKNWSKEFTCTGRGWDQMGKYPCGALLKVSAQDILSRGHTDSYGERDLYYGFVCPVCHCFTEVSYSDIPAEVRSNARTYRY